MTLRNPLEIGYLRVQDQTTLAWKRSLVAIQDGIMLLASDRPVRA